MREGQAAIEYMALIGFLLVLSAPLLVEAQRSTIGLQDSTDQLQVVNMLDTVEEAAILVYAQGEPERISFEVDIPRGVTNTTVKRQYIRVRFQGRDGPSDYIRTFPFNVTGDIPESTGRYTLAAEAEGRTNVTIQVQ